MLTLDLTHPAPTFTSAVAWTHPATATPWTDLRSVLRYGGMTAGRLYLNAATAAVLAACANPADPPEPAITVQLDRDLPDGRGILTDGVQFVVLTVY